MLTHEVLKQLIQELQLEVRDYQIRIIQKTFNSFNSEDFKSILIESPTGSGKTYMCLLTLKLLQLHNPNMSFCWVAMRYKLLCQAESANKQIGVKNIHFLSMFDKNPPKADVTILDESQHSVANTCLSLINKIGSNLLLGATATPYRTDKIKLPFQRIINDCGVRFLVEQGYLSNFDLYTIPKWTPRAVADRYIENPLQWGKSIIFMQTKEQCLEVLKYLQEANIPAAIVFGDQCISFQEEVFSNFENGKISVLLNVYLLTEGFDCCDLQTVWIRDSGKLCVVQMGGRVLRKDPKNPAKVAKIIQSEDTYYPYSHAVKPRRSFCYQGGRWMSIEPGPMVENTVELMRTKHFIKPVVLPKILESKGNRIYVGKNGMVVKSLGVKRPTGD